MLIRKQALDEVGLLDERYFVYMDDVDLCQRLRDRGWSIRYEPAATVVHQMGGASAHAAGEASPVAIENFNDYFLRRHGPGALQALRAIQLVGYGARAVAYATRSLFQPGSVYRRKSREHVRNAHVVLRSVHKDRRVHQPKLIEVRGDGE
jgi:GT2 family glycosyltransferase